MRKALAYITCAAFLLSAISFAADKPDLNAVAGSSSKIGNVKVTKMNARGKVVEVSDKIIKIERKVKNEVEVMEFVLDKPVENIEVSDLVKIVYVEKDGSLLASRVVKIIPKKAGKKEAVSKKPDALQ